MGPPTAGGKALVPQKGKSLVGLDLYWHRRPRTIRPGDEPLVPLCYYVTVGICLSVFCFGGIAPLRPCFPLLSGLEWDLSSRVSTLSPCAKRTPRENHAHTRGARSNWFASGPRIRSELQPLGAAGCLRSLRVGQRGRNRRHQSSAPTF